MVACNRFAEGGVLTWTSFMLLGLTALAAHLAMPWFASRMGQDALSDRRYRRRVEVMAYMVHTH